MLDQLEQVGHHFLFLYIVEYTYNIIIIKLFWIRIGYFLTAIIKHANIDKKINQIQRIDISKDTVELNT